MSKLVSAPRWTPPMPPVAKTPNPATRAQIGAAELGDALRLAELCQLVFRQPDVDTPAHDGDGGGHGAVGAHLGLDTGRGFHVLRIGHSMGDDRRFQRHDGTAAGPCLGNFGREFKRQRHDPGSPET
jgi:hypothetical protein